MKKGFLCRIGLAAICATTSATAVAGTSGDWYTSVGIGLDVPTDADVSASTYRGTNSFDAGFGLESRIGYDLVGALRPEASLSLGKADVSTDSTSGELTTASLFANLWYDLVPTSRFGRVGTLYPYFGGGLGLVQYTLEDYQVAGSGVTAFSDDDMVTALQIGSGILLPLKNLLSLSLDYRFVMGGDPEVGNVDTEYSAHKVYLGIRSPLRFGNPDSDNDGVPDANDACPTTPANIPVGASGCPYDTDADGVADYVDACPGTLPNSSVDERGCVFDSDGDGVGDALDRCPETAAGMPVDESGCELDSDGDGVPDARDRCAATPSNIAVDANGCSADADADGVSDKMDQCDNTPAGAEVMTNGCAADQSLVLKGVNFETNSSKLAPNATRILDAIAETMRQSPNFSIQINGHTDSVGAASYNRALSQKRAEAVRNYLIATGIEASRLKATGLGESNPIASNDTKEGRALNRRVEIRILR